MSVRTLRNKLNSHSTVPN
jgi:hypothetical protein